MAQADSVSITPRLTASLNCRPDGGPAEPAGKLFPQTTLTASLSQPAHPATAPARGRAFKPPTLPRLSRRSLVATMLAAVAAPARADDADQPMLEAVVAGLRGVGVGVPAAYPFNPVLQEASDA